MDKKCLTNLKISPGPTVTLPNNEQISSTEQGQLPLHSKLSNTALTAAVLPGLQSSSLISLGQLCDDDCDILLNKKSLFVVKDNELMMEGLRNKGDKLWDIPIRNPDLLKAKYTTKAKNAGLYSTTRRIKKRGALPK